jgi:hypothetical protein
MGRGEVKANAQHNIYLTALKQCLGEPADKLPLEEILAVTSQFVGNLTAMMDQRQYDSSRVMKLVAGNIKIGNDAAVQQLLNAEGTA